MQVSHFLLIKCFLWLEAKNALTTFLNLNLDKDIAFSIPFLELISFYGVAVYPAQCNHPTEYSLLYPVQMLWLELLPHLAANQT